MPTCPECGSQKTWKDGFRYIQGTPIQRYLCRVCGYRFSEPQIKVNVFREFSETSHSRKDVGNSMVRSFDLSSKKQLDSGSLYLSEDVTSHGNSPAFTNVAKLLKGLPYYSSKCRGHVSDKEMKNLVKVETRTQNALRESIQDAKGQIVSFGWHMQKRGLSDATIKHRIYRLNTLVKLGADLNDPDTIEVILVTSKWSKANKKIFADCYKTYCNYKKIDWDKPKFIVPQKEPFLPLEEEVHQLINGCGKKTGTLLQLLYETGVRIGEASLLKWTDIDFKAKNLRVNCPEKGGNSRTVDISEQLIAMLKALPKREDGHIFNPKSRTHGSTFNKQRNRIALRLGNPRIKDIHFHTLRHLRATLTYYASDGDILRVKYLLGHKRLDTTGRYAHYQAFKKEEYTTKRATTREEEDQLLNEGYKFIRYDTKHDEVVLTKRM